MPKCLCVLVSATERRILMLLNEMNGQLDQTMARQSSILKLLKHQNDSGSAAPEGSNLPLADVADVERLELKLTDKDYSRQLV